jgi:hypothetical protein
LRRERLSGQRSRRGPRQSMSRRHRSTSCNRNATGRAADRYGTAIVGFARTCRSATERARGVPRAPIRTPAQPIRPVADLIVVRSRGLEPPRVAPLAPQASASTNSATTADGRARADCPRIEATALDVTNRPQRNKGDGVALHPPGLGLAGVLVRISPPRAGLDSAPPRDVAGAERPEQKPRWSLRAIL